MTRRERLLRGAIDPAIALLLAAGYVALLLGTVKNLGYARDEGFYFQAAQSYGRWFDLLLSGAPEAFDRSTIDQAWRANHEHPALMKSLFALSHRYLYAGWHWFSVEGTAYRFPGMLMSGLAVAVTYLWGRRAVGRGAGVVAALMFALMPRIFYHSHLACFDMPVAAMWLVTTYAYWRSITGGGLRWALATGVLYGLLLNTKHNAWLLPAALILHVVISRGPRLWRELRAGRLRVPAALLAMAVIGPALLVLSWPWLWHDTGARLTEWFAFHTGHEYYNMEFLGRTYWKPPMPRLYAWVMTAGTVPLVTLSCFVLGLGSRVRRHVSERAYKRATDHEYSTDILWVLCILTSYGPWLSSNTPIFGGTKHWITAYPFLCLFAAHGFQLVRERIAALVGGRKRLIEVGMALSVLVAPLAITLHSHPWGLSAYTPLVGGAPGAASLGLNRTFWGYTTGSVQGYLNENVPPNGSVYVHDTAMQSFEMMRADERIRPDIRGSWTIHGSSYALYHHEPHMGRVEYQIWVDYGTTTPAHVGAYDGVPVVWVYARPK